jgi:carboxyl-terminal processing protease
MSLCSAAALLVFATGVVGVQAGRRAVTLAVIMTNDPVSNQIKVYDVDTHVLLQTLSTHGKGTVQQLNPLRYWIESKGFMTNDPGTLKITKAKFYRASGASTQLKGVMSDIVLPSRLNYMKDIGESSLENALRWDTIPTAKYDRLNLVEPFLPDLLRLSNERVATNQDFAYVREDIERFRKALAEKTVSLNEKVRLKEKEELDARNKGRDKERLARQESAEKTFEITLKQAQLPGLPPPVTKTNSTLAKVLGPKASLVAVAGTNSPIAAAKQGVSDTSNLDGELDEEKAPAVDAALIESEHILMDYLSLLPKGSLATTGPSALR